MRRLTFSIFLIRSVKPSSLSSHTSTGNADASNSSPYVNFVTRGLGKIVDHVVPLRRQGLPNLTSIKQVFRRQCFHPLRDNYAVHADTRNLTKKTRYQSPSLNDRDAALYSPTASRHSSHLPQSEVFRRIEEDQEQHK
jgi:hypothetical protein